MTQAGGPWRLKEMTPGAVGERLLLRPSLIVPVGTTASFEIQNIDLAKKRIGVGLVAEEERDDYTAPPEASTKGFGSLADKLKDVLKPKPD